MISRVLPTFTLCLFVTGCNAEPLASMTFPLLKSCESFITEYAKYQKAEAKENSYEITVNVNRFDSVPLSHLDLLGFVTLELKGDFKTIDPIPPERYLSSQINGIYAQCTPDRYTEFMLEGDKRASSEYIFDFSKKHEAKHLQRTEKGIRVYYNDGSYQFPLPNK